MKNKGWRKLIKEPKEKPTLALKDLEKYLTEIFKERPQESGATFNLPQGLMSWEEVSLITNITREEYANSTGLYRISDNCMGGIGAWEAYQEALQKEISKFTIKPDEYFIDIPAKQMDVSTGS